MPRPKIYHSKVRGSVYFAANGKTENTDWLAFIPMSVRMTVGTLAGWLACVCSSVPSKILTRLVRICPNTKITKNLPKHLKSVLVIQGLE